MRRDVATIATEVIAVANHAVLDALRLAPIGLCRTEDAFFGRSRYSGRLCSRQSGQPRREHHSHTRNECDPKRSSTLPQGGRVSARPTPRATSSAVRPCLAVAYRSAPRSTRNRINIHQLILGFAFDDLVCHHGTALAFRLDPSYGCRCPAVGSSTGATRWPWVPGRTRTGTVIVNRKTHAVTP